jgi:hypothetical protein
MDLSNRLELAGTSHSDEERVAQFRAKSGEGVYLLRAIEEPPEPWTLLPSTGAEPAGSASTV